MTRVLFAEDGRRVSLGGRQRYQLDAVRVLLLYRTDWLLDALAVRVYALYMLLEFSLTCGRSSSEANLESEIRICGQSLV